MPSVLRVTFRDKKMGAAFKAAQGRTFARVHAALGKTTRLAAGEIKTRGDADITRAGRFGSRWTNGFHSIPRLSGTTYSIDTFSDIFYFTVFEFGKVIHGKPLLWIPLSFAKDAIGVMARDFPGGLFRVDRKAGGAPLLLSIKDGQPKYFGKASVKIPQKFHIRQICRNVAKRIKTIYAGVMRNG